MMMDTGFTGTLTISADKYDIVAFTMSYSRDYDNKGRPCSAVRANQLQFTIEITDMVKLVETMINAQNKPIATGTVEFWQSGIAGAFRKVTFSNAFIVSYSEGFQVTGSDNFVCDINITAEKIDCGLSKYDASWPLTS